VAYPDRLEDVERLIEQHRRLDRQQLLLAIYFDCQQDPGSVYLLEVISQFGYDEVSDDRELFEMSYGSTDGFPLPSGSRLDIILTNPVELRAAVEQGWTSLSPLLAAIEAGPEHYRVVYHSDSGDELLGLLRQGLVAA
jgi:hypothetical protein